MTFRPPWCAPVGKQCQSFPYRREAQRATCYDRDAGSVTSTLLALKLQLRGLSLMLHSWASSLRHFARALCSASNARRLHDARRSGYAGCFQRAFLVSHQAHQKGPVTIFTCLQAGLESVFMSPMQQNPTVSCRTYLQMFPSTLVPFQKGSTRYWEHHWPSPEWHRAPSAGLHRPGAR